jgi:hypothetical protein
MENDKLPELSKLYDEMWKDARTLVKDMNRSIRAVSFFGVMCFFLALFQLSTFTTNYDKVVTGTARWPLDYVYMGGGAVGVLAFVAIGVGMLMWYNTLRQRYSRLLEMEKKLGD